MSTDLHKRMLAFDYIEPPGNTERSDLMRQVWAPTPWMVDVFTGSCGAARDREMLEWLFDTFGEMASPIHDRVGVWQRGGCTINGWTWFGFSTEAQMNLFQSHWPTPAGVKVPA